MNWKKTGKRAGIAGFAVLFAAAGFFLWYVNDFYHGDAAAIQAMQSDAGVQVIPEEYGWLFDGPGQEDALIFYPGGKVEAEAYAPLLQRLARQGLDCYLAAMPFNLAVFGMSRAQSILDADLAAYKNWYIGGHSLGGAMAASFASSHLDELDGIVLLGAYPTSSLKREGFRAVLIYGSEDGVLNRTRLQQAMPDLPEDTQVFVLDGGNHAQFGSYGLQQGDGTALISWQEQQKITAEDIFRGLDLGIIPEISQKGQK